MNLQKVLHDDKFNMFFSLLVGIGIICMIRPMCSGPECNVKKAPAEKDFDKFVYRLGDTCYAFATEIVTCPSSGTIEAFREMSGPFARRDTPIHRA
jgi:hypothetical protein